ncbi:MAG: hypothetical protein WBX01_08360 [Nitrososphaeraceae archaeon]
MQRASNNSCVKSKNRSKRTVKADAFICGDDSKSKTVVKNLATAIGFDTADAGPGFAVDLACICPANGTKYCFQIINQKLRKLTV